MSPYHFVSYHTIHSHVPYVTLASSSITPCSFGVKNTPTLYYVHIHVRTYACIKQAQEMRIVYLEKQKLASAR